ncbi:MAG: methionyl-tRNA formyltransferase, partial [Rhabdochlamydiaceae bacterium]
ILKHLLESPHQIIAVVTKPDQPQGRSLKLKPSSIKEWVQAHTPTTALYQPPKASADAFVALMQSLSPDLFVVASYGEIMKTSLLNVPRLGSINVHASLLPKWRGAAPIQRSLMAGEQETGITIMKMVLQLDAGDILAVAKVAVPVEMNHGELEHALALAAKAPLLHVLSELENGTIQATPQDASKVTFAFKITPAETIIDWSRPAIDIHNQIRALSPDPGAWTMIEISGQTKKLKIKRSSIMEHSSSTPRQTYFLTQKEWVIGCGENLLTLLDVQLEGKKTLSIADFLRGLHQKPRIL